MSKAWKMLSKSWVEVDMRRSSSSLPLINLVLVVEAGASLSLYTPRKQEEEEEERRVRTETWMDLRKRRLDKYALRFDAKGSSGSAFICLWTCGGRHASMFIHTVRRLIQHKPWHCHTIEDEIIYADFIIAIIIMQQIRKITRVEYMKITKTTTRRKF